MKGKLKTHTRRKVFVLGDNIDTDQIIPAQYLTLVPTIPAEYGRLGSYALAGLPEGCEAFVADGCVKSEFGIIIAGKNFGCGSSREHAPIALGAAGLEAVVAESFARIFFRNTVSTGELYPIECCQRLLEMFTTGDEAELDLPACRITNLKTGRVMELKPLGEAGPVIAAGGLFEYARSTGMISGPGGPG